MQSGKPVLMAAIVTAAWALTGCSGSSAPAPTGPPVTTVSSGTSAPSSDSPAAVTESNSPGDIPDNQAYVEFTPPGGGFSVKIPEGWASASAGAATTFTDKLNQVEVTAAQAATAPTVASVTATDVPLLKQRVPQFAPGAVSTVSRQAGPAILATYQGDSPPNPVTGKVVRDTFERYVFFRAGTRVDVTVSGPTNADNVDPWRTVTDSLRWL